MTARRRRIWGIGVMCAATVAAWPSDPAVLRWFAEHRRDGLNPAVVALTSAWTLTAFVFGACAWLAFRRRVKESLAVAIVTVATLGIGSVLKMMIGRHRPYESLVDFVSLKTAADASFPSNHTSSAFAACLLLGSLEPRLRFPALAFAAAVALTRMYVGVHYPSDICGGLALALAACAVAREFVGPRPEPAPGHAAASLPTPPDYP